MKYTLLFSAVLLSSCASITGGEPVVVDLGNYKYYVSAKTGTSPITQTEKAAKKFSAKAIELCGGSNYSETNIREWYMEHPPTGLGLYKISIKDGTISCHHRT